MYNEFVTLTFDGVAPVLGSGAVAAPSKRFLSAVTPRPQIN